MSKVIIITASRGENLKLSEKLLNEISKNTSSEIINLLDLKLPLYTLEEENENGVPRVITDLGDNFNKASAFVFSFPEYNGGIPPVLVNAIAWFTRSSDNWRDLFFGRFVLLATHSGSGGLAVLSAMRLQLSYLGMNVLGYNIHTNFQKPLKLESIERAVSLLLGIISS